MTIDRKALSWIELAMLILLILLYGWATYQRNFIWKDDVTLWSDVVKKSPAKVRPHNNLAVSYNERKLTEQAIAEALIALRLSPNYPYSFALIGDAYFEKGLFDMAIMLYKHALSIKSDYLNPNIRKYCFKGMGNAYAKKGEMNLAIKAFKKAVKLSPNDITARVNLAAVYGSMGLTGQAITELRYALTVKPDSSDTHYNLGIAYEQLAESYELRAMSQEQLAGSRELIVKAITEYKKALMLNPDDIQARERMIKLRAKSK